MNADRSDTGSLTLLSRIRELEDRLTDCQETLEAIRRGDADALVVAANDDQHQIYTLKSADRPYQMLIEQMQEGAVTLGFDGTVLYCNRRLATMLGMPQQRIVGQPLHPFVDSADLAVFERLLRDATRGVTRDELTLTAADGRAIPVYLSLNVLREEGTDAVLCGILTDLTEQKQHVHVLAAANERLRQEIAERERVEDALRQAQKMEAVGQLTGGLAHDFNNLLAGIMGNLELLQKRLKQGRVTDLDRYIEAAQGASRRAASVTHRLLAFSRRQTLDPQPTDVNRLVLGMEELIHRTVGPSVVLVVRPAAGLWTSRIDSSQLESALLNLCINARDAMPDGGQITIETSNRSLDGVRAARLGIPAGDYIALAVTDQGCGMPQDVIKRAFDPFFTTKPLGQGTGLGLSMIYGFAQQSGGQISIESTVGAGTTMWLHLPRYDGEATDRVIAAANSDIMEQAQGETVLVVDDEPSVRALIAEVLSDQGYRVIQAGEGVEALGILRTDIRIDLLVTDVGLPGGMNGRQIADAGLELRPQMKVLFITGYAEAVVLGERPAGHNTQVLTKPFTVDALGLRISNMLAGV
ncbi:MAG: response regulator [Proteobacteria bacterium]|nr:response regulator [Pseudomonadota bacterium]